jgi:hypothetical protein
MDSRRVLSSIIGEPRTVVDEDHRWSMRTAHCEQTSTNQQIKQYFVLEYSKYFEYTTPSRRKVV